MIGVLHFGFSACPLNSFGLVLPYLTDEQFPTQAVMCVTGSFSISEPYAGMTVSPNLPLKKLAAVSGVFAKPVGYGRVTSTPPPS